MKLDKSGLLSWVVSLFILMLATLAIPRPVLAQEVIVNPGYLSGVVNVPGEQIIQVVVRAIDGDKQYPSSTTVSFPDGSDQLEYTLTVEGNHDYHVMVEAWLAGSELRTVFSSVTAPVSVPIGGTVPNFNFDITSALISGNISSNTSGNTINRINLSAKIWVSEFGQYFYSTMSAGSLSVPGQPGLNYALNVAPGVEYLFAGSTTINDITFTLPAETVLAPAAGQQLNRDFVIDVTATQISGSALLQSDQLEVTNASISGASYTPPPARYASTGIDNLLTGDYSMNVTPGSWYVQPTFSYQLLTSELVGQWGTLRVPSSMIDLVENEQAALNFIINPGYIAGNVSLTGANPSLAWASMTADSLQGNGQITTRVNPHSGAYLFAAAAAEWQVHRYELGFDYPNDTDASLFSRLTVDGASSAVVNVAAGNTVADINQQFATAVVKVLYTVAGGGQLNNPRLKATSIEPAPQPSVTADGWGSGQWTNKGQAAVTLMPGSYDLNASANVGGSQTSFGNFSVSVGDGDYLVIGGTNGPRLKLSSPADGAEIDAVSVIVSGTATDNQGVASVTINGEPAILTSTNNAEDVYEISFNHETALTLVGNNVITIEVTDNDGSAPVTLSLQVVRTEQAVSQPTIVQYSGDTLLQYGSQATLAASLYDENSQPLAGGELMFEVAGQQCAATTGSSGLASCQLIISGAGVHQVMISFAGNNDYTASASTALLTVYNPDGGFVTGGGWLNSPEGAYLADAAISGRAHFGFVSKYHHGETVPTGQTQFQFKAADVKFHSDYYSLLVVSGDQAQYSGGGSLNGLMGYTFTLTAVDGDLGGGTDSVRMIISDQAGNTVYDNQLVTQLEGGNIVIHTP